MIYKMFVKQLFFLSIFSTSLFSQILSPNSLFPEDSLSSKLTLTFVGDFMCHGPQINSALIEETNTYEFSSVYENVKGLLSQSDLTFGNLETVTAGKMIKYQGYPTFNTPDEFVYELKETGFDYLFTANNHAIDQFELGVRRTLEIIKKAGLISIGSQKKGENRYHIIEKNGIKLGILAATYGTNGFSLPTDSEWEVNEISKNLLKEELSELKKKNLDVIIVYFHFGNEYEKSPSGYQKEFVNFAFNNGAGIVIGSHPHVLQPIVITSKSKIENGFVAFSLGNFVSNQQWRFSDSGVILNFSIVKNYQSKLTYVEDLHYIPTWVYKGKTEKKEVDFLIIPDLQENSLIFDSEKTQLMKQSFNDSKRILSGETEIK